MAINIYHTKDPDKIVIRDNFEIAVFLFCALPIGVLLYFYFLYPIFISKEKIFWPLVIFMSTGGFFLLFALLYVFKFNIYTLDRSNNKITYEKKSILKNYEKKVYEVNKDCTLKIVKEIHSVGGGVHGSSREKVYVLYLSCSLSPLSESEEVIPQFPSLLKLGETIFLFLADRAAKRIKSFFSLQPPIQYYE